MAACSVLPANGELRRLAVVNNCCSQDDPKAPILPSTLIEPLIDLDLFLQRWTEKLTHVLHTFLLGDLSLMIEQDVR